jgi:hypothetical protein
MESMADVKHQSFREFSRGAGIARDVEKDHRQRS